MYFAASLGSWGLMSCMSRGVMVTKVAARSWIGTLMREPLIDWVAPYPRSEVAWTSKAASCTAGALGCAGVVEAGCACVAGGTGCWASVRNARPHAKVTIRNLIPARRVGSIVGG